MELAYTKVGGYYIPDLILDDQPDKPLDGMAGCARNFWRNTILTPMYN